VSAPREPKPRVDNDCRVRVAAGQDITYEEYSRVLFERAWERNQQERNGSVRER